MEIKELESINDYFRDETKFIGEFQMQHYKVIRGYIGGYGDELRLYYTRFEPLIKKASLCIVHGFGEHQGRFLHVADLFAKLNFTVHLIDLRGFGYSGGPRGSQTLKELHMDVEILIRQASKDLPLFIYGHAMGGLLVISFLLRNPFIKVSGLITTAPMLGFPMDRKLKGIKYFAVKYFGQYMEDLVIHTRLNITGMSKNDHHIQRCFQDKLLMPFLGIGMAKSILDTLTYLYLNLQNFKFSILILHGKKDVVSDYQESIKFYEKCGSKDKEIKLYDNGYHELQHDFEFTEIKEIITNWCLQRLPNADPFGILMQSRLNYGIPYSKKKSTKQILLGLILICYMLIIMKFKSSFNKHQYPIIPFLIIYKYYQKKNSNDRPFKKSFKGNNRRNNQSFYRRKYSRDNQNGNTSQHKPFSRRFGFKKNQNGKFRSFRTGKKRFEQRKGESFQNKLDRQLEDYKNGREVSSNRATQRLDNALDTYFQRGSTTRENRMDQALENYWKQGNE